MIFGNSNSENSTATIVQVNVPQNFSEEVKAGEGLFNKNCSACHGKSAAGSQNGPPLVHGLYETNHHGNEAFYRAAKQGVQAHHWKFGNMPPVKGVTRDDVKPIIEYVRSLQRANGIF